MSAGITDSHAHLQGNYFEDGAAVVARARAAGVTRMVVVGTDLASSRAAFALCAGEEGLYPTAGMHPHDAAESDALTREGIEALCRKPECVAVGETGLDWFRNRAPRVAQLDNFAWQLDLAQRLGKPVVIHCREAHVDTVHALEAFPLATGVMHCYSMGVAELEPYLAHGLMISFSGIVTYPKNEALRAAAAAVPDERLLVETDCPYLAPQPRRGQQNEPALIVHTLATLAEVRGTTVAALAELTTRNAERLFGL